MGDEVEPVGCRRSGLVATCPLRRDTGRATPIVCHAVCQILFGGSIMRARKVSLVCYSQPTEQQLSGAIRWAYILHDKDYVIDTDTGEATLKKPHYHVYLEFGNPRYFASVAKEYDLPEAAVCKVASTKATLAYLTHRTAKAIKDGKYMYDPGEVVQSDDLEFDFSAIFDSAETVDWLKIFTMGSLHEAIAEYKAQGEELNSLQQFKNFVQTYHTIGQINREENGQL